MNKDKTQPQVQTEEQKDTAAAVDIVDRIAKTLGPVFFKENDQQAGPEAVSKENPSVPPEKQEPVKKPKKQRGKAEKPVEPSPPITSFTRDATGQVRQLVRKGYIHQTTGTKAGYSVRRGLSCNNFTVHLLNPNESEHPASLHIGFIAIQPASLGFGRIPASDFSVVFDIQALNMRGEATIATVDRLNGQCAFTLENTDRSMVSVFGPLASICRINPRASGDFLDFWAEFITLSMETIFNHSPDFVHMVKSAFDWRSLNLPFKAPPPKQGEKLEQLIPPMITSDYRALRNIDLKGITMTPGYTPVPPTPTTPSQVKPRNTAEPVQLKTVDVTSMSKADLQALMYKVDNTLRVKRVEACRMAVVGLSERSVRDEYDVLLRALSKHRNDLIDDQLDRLELLLNIDG